MGRVTFVGHVADRTGAPTSLLRLLRWLRRASDLEFDTVLVRGGERLPEFEQLSKVTVLQPEASGALPGAALLRRAHASLRFRRTRQRLAGDPDGLVFFNSVATAPLFEALGPIVQPIVGRVPERRHAMSEVGDERVRALCARASELYAVSRAVAGDLEALDEGLADRVRCVPGFVPRVTESDLTAAAAVRASLGIGHGATVIGGVGTLGWCKGSDLFVQVARSVLGGSRAPGAHFVWIGADPTGRELERHRHDVARLGLEGRVHFVGPTARPEAYHDSFDLLLLTSRDDACPVVVLEAGQRGVPTVCFAQSGGAPEFADKDAGVVVPYLDVAAMGKAVKGLIRDAGRRRALGEAARDKVLEVHDVDVVGPLLLERIHTHLAQGAAAPTVETRAVRVADGEPPGIEPVADGNPRPFWTVAVPTHRPPPLLKSTLESVLAQDPGPEAMQILVVDDGSGDDRARALVEQLAPDRIEYIGNPTSLGIARSWNSCLAASRGEWIHLLHQDDLVRPGFYAALAAGVRERPEVGAAFCRHFVTDDAGHWQGISPLERPSPGMLEGWLARLASGQCIQCPAIVVRRSVYEKLGGFRPDLIYALDWEMWLRIARTEKFWYEPEPLAAYRCHAANESSRLQRTGDTVADVRRAARVATQSLAPALRRDALRYCTRHALETAGRSFARADHAGAWAQLRAAFREDRSPWFWWQLARATWAGLAGRLRRRR